MSYANVVATLALFVALGGSAYAVKQLPKNSVGKRQIKKNAVIMPKIRRNAVNGPRVKNNSLTGADIKLSKLGTVPSAKNAAAAGTANVANTANTANAANVANIANSLAPAEPWHEVGAPGEPPFLNSWENEGADLETAAFYKDKGGIVHIRGVISGGSAGKTAFELPPGYRPAVGKQLVFPVLCTPGGFCNASFIGPTIVLGESGSVAPPGDYAHLNEIAFRAES